MVRLGLVNQIILAAPSAIVGAAITDGRVFLAAFAITVIEIVAAILIAWTSGIIVGVVAGSSNTLAAATAPVLSSIFAIPLIIVYPLLMAWLGIGPVSKIVFGVLSGFFPIALNTIDGVRAIERRYLAFARSIGATTWQTYTRIIFPLALPSIVSGLRVGTGLVVIGVIVTEMLASLGGVGFLISYHRTLFNTGHVYFGIALALTMAVAVNVGLTWLDRRVGLWRILERTDGWRMAEWMVGVDTGGTFTDLVAFEPGAGELRTIKVPSVPADPSTAVINALDELFRGGVAPQEIGSLVHGTTVATNAVLESAGVRAGLLITRGFRAVYEARGWVRPDPSELLDTFFRKPASAHPAVAHRGDPRARGLSGDRARAARRAGGARTQHGGSRPRACRRSRSATCSASATARTRSAPPRSSPRRSRAGASRCRRACFRSSANTRASRPPRSTPMWARSWSATWSISISGSRRAASPRRRSS